MLVKDFMTSNPVTVAPGKSAEETLELMKSLNFRQCPVIEDGKLVGIVTDRDLRTSLAGGSGAVVGDIMAKDPVTILDYASVEGAAEIIRIGKFNALPVVTNKGELVGILSVTDLLDALLKMLGFHEKPQRLEVQMPDGIGMFDVLQVIQSNSEKVLSFSAAPENRKLYYFWVVKCNFGEVEKALRQLDTRISTIHP
ncbi:MAG TPA: CBS domain-containing protein [Thermodesulfobacteriota bacterium]|nr:CBS domain-containing protein [Thermodesulfobacteriota bacterium]